MVLARSRVQTLMIEYNALCSISDYLYTLVLTLVISVVFPICAEILFLNVVKNITELIGADPSLIPPPCCRLDA